ncbi:MAG: FecR domain-containing protein [Nitrospinae bacterium]|nr:FecR domain-containing protein [Nitrospinota bacterium]
MSFARLFLSAVCLLAVFVPASQALDFSAEIADLDGQATILQKATGKQVQATKGMKLFPGDVIETKPDAEVELLYDDGNVSRLAEKTTLTIHTLSVDENKNKATILELAVGKVKNYVSKLDGPGSKFEVHTKTAVAGVTGTPPWVVGAFNTTGGQQRVEVDLLVGKNGGVPTKGVFVKGTDRAGTTVNLLPGTRTTAMPGMPPFSPIPIAPARLQQLQTAMPKTTPPEVQQKKMQELDKKTDKKTEKGAQSGDKSTTTEKADKSKTDAPAQTSGSSDSSKGDVAGAATSVADHIANNVSLGQTGATTPDATGDKSGVSKISGANLNALPNASHVNITISLGKK